MSAGVIGAAIGDKLKSAVGQVKSAMGTQDQQEKGLLAQVDDAVTLTWKQRLIGFSCCLGIGILLTIISLPFLWMLRFTPFAIA